MTNQEEKFEEQFHASSLPQCQKADSNSPPVMQVVSPQKERATLKSL